MLAHCTTLKVLAGLMYLFGVEGTFTSCRLGMYGGEVSCVDVDEGSLMGHDCLFTNNAACTDSTVELNIEGSADATEVAPSAFARFGGTLHIRGAHSIRSLSPCGVWSASIVGLAEQSCPPPPKHTLYTHTHGHTPHYAKSLHIRTAVHPNTMITDAPALLLRYRVCSKRSSHTIDAWMLMK
jgi:hypothetical protein